MNICNNIWSRLAYFFSAIGAINWGTVAFFKFNFIDYFDSLLGRIGSDMIFYALIALGGLYAIVIVFISCENCKK